MLCFQYPSYFANVYLLKNFTKHISNCRLGVFEKCRQLSLDDWDVSASMNSSPRLSCLFPTIIHRYPRWWNCYSDEATILWSRYENTRYPRRKTWENSHEHRMGGSAHCWKWLMYYIVWITQNRLFEMTSLSLTSTEEIRYSNLRHTSTLILQLCLQSSHSNHGGWNHNQARFVA